MIQMILNAENNIEAGKSTRLQFAPVDANDPGRVVELETVHTQKLHLIIVSEDLSFFSHQHPECKGNSYVLAFTFPQGGNYLLYADYKPIGEEPIVDVLPVKVGGVGVVNKGFASASLVASQDDVEVRLCTDNITAIKVIALKNGERLSASGIDDFLGAKAHVVMIHTVDKDFLHVHPMVHGEDLVLHASFTKTGIYRAWVQFLVSGKLYTTDFVLQVDKLPAKSHMMHNHH